MNNDETLSKPIRRRIKALKNLKEGDYAIIFSSSKQPYVILKADGFDFGCGKANFCAKVDDEQREVTLRYSEISFFNKEHKHNNTFLHISFNNLCRVYILSEEIAQNVNEINSIAKDENDLEKKLGVYDAGLFDPNQYNLDFKLGVVEEDPLSSSSNYYKSTQGTNTKRNTKRYTQTQLSIY